VVSVNSGIAGIGLSLIIDCGMVQKHCVFVDIILVVPVDSNMGADLEQWKHCLIKSIQLFCRNFCQYDQEAKIDGLLAITLDQKEVILVKLQEVDNDASSQRDADRAATDQSELLESILRFLAPSCRLLKKTAIAPTLPSVWQPVSDRSASAEMPDRFTFLRSLGLAPTALVSNRKVETSYASRLRTRSSRRAIRSIPPFSYFHLPVSPRVLETRAAEVHSEPPTLSPCPSRGVPSLSKSECSEPSDDGTPLPTLRRCVSDDEKKPESASEFRKSEHTSQPLTVDCNKNTADLNGVAHHARLLNSKPASLLQVVNSISCDAGHDNASNSKKSPNCTCKDTHSPCDHVQDKKPVHQPKKRSHVNVVSSVVSKNKSSTTVNVVAVKRLKAQPSENVTHGKSENGTSSVRPKANASRLNKKLAKVKEKAGNCKLKTGLNARGWPVKTAASVSSKRISLKSSVTASSQKDVKNAHRKLLNKTKVCRYVLIGFDFRLLF